MTAFLQHLPTVFHLLKLLACIFFSRGVSSTPPLTVCKLLQVPLFLRQYVSSLSAFPDTSANAYSSGDQIAVFNLTGFDVFIHESTHSQDWATNNHQYGSPAWDAAIAADSCVADYYAKVSNVEAYAQAMVTYLYKLLQPFDPTVAGNVTDCMSNQLAFISNSQAPGLQNFIKVRGCRAPCYVHSFAQVCTVPTPISCII